ncbi:TetR family transcriptional regulator [Mesorhizobium hungaricum]|jgi:AcrR family transcriptional regulator|uniref:TetR family transcriptional regulator n=1 Tax=Mesorhizobium hungaricum TaxID=1566387 RepID=A0A1C2DP65_9HYPH|nr:MULTISPECIES: TetR/AcrR family transcriptional regulator [Mesorhizobium]OCX16568.1 TetR family transcriptional regulator [Mesorhizobium hungaricum]
MDANRKRILESALALFLERPFEDVTLQAIAEASGVSHQTVLNHFESKDGVAAGSAEILAHRTAAARSKAVPNNIRSIIDTLVDDYEQIGDANARWAASSERLGSLAALLDVARTNHQAWLDEMFSDHLPKSAKSRSRTVNALHAATDVYVWKLLRRDLRLGRSETQEVIETLVNGVIASSRRVPSGKRSG